MSPPDTFGPAPEALVIRGEAFLAVGRAVSREGEGLLREVAGVAVGELALSHAARDLPGTWSARGGGGERCM